MSNVFVNKQKIDLLANAISAKSGEPVTMTLDEMVSAVDGIDTDGITPTGNINIEQAGTTDVTNYATVTVPYAGEPFADYGYWYETVSGQRKWNLSSSMTFYNGGGWVDFGTSILMPSYTVNAIPTGTTITPSTSQQTIGGANYVMEGAIKVNAMPTGTAGTPTATKGTVSNHSVSVTPSVTNTTGYITGGTKSGTAVSISASELVSGSQTITSNGTTDVTNLASVVVNVPTGGGSSMNAQAAQSTTRSTSTTYTEVISLTCDTAGTYDVYWSTFRSSTSGTWGSQLYIGNSAHGSAQTGSWSNHIQNIHMTGVQIDAGEEVSVRVRSRGSNYYGYVGTLTIVQTA